MQISAESASATGRVILHLVAIARLSAAWLLTLLVLPYLWGRSFIGLQLTGRPETRFGLLLLVVMAVVFALTYRLGSVPTRRHWLIPVVIGVGFTWIIVNVAV